MSKVLTAGELAPDFDGYVRFAHYGKSMSDIPTNAELLQVIDELNAASH
jgi:hypothetical protein